MSIDTKLSYIDDFFSTYESKIKRMNQLGCLSTAKLFEGFAAGLLKIWFGKSFINLNENICNYEAVDLISEDNKLYVQVSTVKDRIAKIRSTLDLIGKLSRFKNLDSIYFFMLGNEISQKTIDNKFSSYPINVKVLTLKSILNRALSDNDFLLELHAFIKENDDLMDSLVSPLERAQDESVLRVKDMSCSIANEYCIDRSNELKDINKDNPRHVLITGEPGVGKSVLARLLWEEFDGVHLFQFSEAFAASASIDNVFLLNLRDLFEYSQAVCIFIDRLESIIGNNIALDNLKVLFALAESFPKVRIIMACRTYDVKEFIVICNTYHIKSFELQGLSDSELDDVSDFFPIIHNYKNDGVYSDLLRIPFYLNEIILNKYDLDKFDSENAFRKMIWTERIGASDTDIRKTVNYIVFERTINSLIGVLADSCDSSCLEILEKKGIIQYITDNDGVKLVRMKYDIYEDICFENFFDNTFVSCRHDYNEFFRKLDEYGVCIYRRYESWISRRLKDETGRGNVLSILLDTFKNIWYVRTLSGVLKSSSSDVFFDMYGEFLFQDKLDEFIKSSLMYSYGYTVSKFNDFNYLTLLPIGKGRGYLIRFLYEHEKYRSKDYFIYSYLLCLDYTNSRLSDRTKSFDEAACGILKFTYNLIEEPNMKKKMDSSNPLFCCLDAIYKLADSAESWIVDLWDKWIQGMYSDAFHHVYCELIKDAVSQKHVRLIECIPDALCRLADKYWHFSNSEVSYNYLNGDSLYGLNDDFTYRSNMFQSSSPFKGYFFIDFFVSDFMSALDWSIEFINQTIDFRIEHEADISQKSDIRLFEFDFTDNVKSQYWGNESMWLASFMESGSDFPVILGDLIFCMKEVFCVLYSRLAKSDLSKAIEFALNVKKTILDKSNNIMPFVVIMQAGLYFSDDLPGYAIDLISSTDLVYSDWKKSIDLPFNSYATSRYTKVFENSSDIVIPYAGNKKNKNGVAFNDLIDYIFKSSLLEFDENMRGRVFELIDKAYDNFSDSSEDMDIKILYNKMDIRKAVQRDLNNGSYEIWTGFSEDVKSYLDSKKSENKDVDIWELAYSVEQRLKNKTISKDECWILLDRILSESIGSPEGINLVLYDHWKRIVANYLEEFEVDEDERFVISRIWCIDAITKLREHQHIALLDSDIPILNQMIYVMPLDTHLHMRITLFKVLESLEIHDPSFKIIQSFLKKQTELGTDFYDLYLGLSLMKKQEMDKVSSMYENTNDIDIHRYLYRNEFQKRRDEYAMTFFVGDKVVDLFEFLPEKYDLYDLGIAFSFGISFVENAIELFKNAFTYFLSYISVNSNSSNETFNRVDYIYDFIFRDMIQNCDEKLIALAPELIGTVDWTMTPRVKAEFFLKSFSFVSAVYIDSYEEPSKRKWCRKLLSVIEPVVAKIEDMEVRSSLEKIFLLYPGTVLNRYRFYNTRYDRLDFIYMNTMFKRYGINNFTDLLFTLDVMQIDKLIPEILPSLSYCLAEVNKLDQGNRLNSVLEDSVSMHSFIRIISCAYLNKMSEIKSNKTYLDAFICILDILGEHHVKLALICREEFSNDSLGMNQL